MQHDCPHSVQEPKGNIRQDIPTAYGKSAVCLEKCSQEERTTKKQNVARTERRNRRAKNWFLQYFVTYL